VLKVVAERRDVLQGRVVEVQSHPLDLASAPLDLVAQLVHEARRRRIGRPKAVAERSPADERVGVTVQR